MFGWFKARRRKQVLAQPFPRPWQELLHHRVWQYRELSAAHRDKLHNCVKVMVAEKTWEGCDGFQVTDAIRVTIAGHAAMMLLGTRDYFFGGVRTVLVYPHAFDRRTNHQGLYDSELRGGEAWQNGPIVLSWDDVIGSSRFSKTAQNIVVHEFAHHLDGLDGEMGGTPIFANKADQKEWSTVMQREFADLQTAAQRGQWTVLRHYGAKNKAEFFAVSSECFFETPLELQRTHQELYALLRKLYRVDPLDWVT